MGAVFGADTGFHLGETYPTGLLFLGLAVFAAIGALSHQRERAFSASLIYLALGVAGAIAVGVLNLGWLDPVEDAQTVERAAELAVIIALFSAGLKLDRPLRWRSWGSVARLLAIAMPLTIGAVALFGTAVLGLSLGAAIVLGAALAPTDPVLAGDIGVGPPGDEDEREPNFALTAEAGLNDGLAFPFVLVGLSVAEGGRLVRASGCRRRPLRDHRGHRAGRRARAPAGRGRSSACATSTCSIPGLDGWVAVAATLAIYGLTEVAGASASSRCSSAGSRSAATSTTTRSTAACTRAPRWSRSSASSR